MARPTKGNERHATRRVSARVSRELQQQLARLAQQNGRTVTDELLAAIDAHLERHREHGSAPCVVSSDS